MAGYTFNDRVRAKQNKGVFGQKPGSIYDQMADKKRQEELARIEQYKKERDDMSNLLKQQPEFLSATGSAEFGKLKDFAYGTEDSPYAALQKQRAQMQTSQALDTGAREGQSALTSVYDQLAMGGGLSSGSRERLAGDAGRQALVSRQGTRAAGSEALLGIDSQQADQRMKAQEGVLSAQSADINARNAYQQDKFKLGAEVQAAQRKAEAEREIAKANSCFAEGSLIKGVQGPVRVETVQVGDVLPGGIVYTVQKSLAPRTMHAYKGTYITGGHAVLEDGTWTRVGTSRLGVEVETPESVQFIYNFGVTNHFIESVDGVMFSDLHESDQYEFLSDEDCLAELNRKWGVDEREEVTLR